MMFKFKSEEVPVTCALAVVDLDGKILLAHPTGAGYLGSWSLPKGLRDLGETEAEAACREVREETGLIIDPFEVIEIGRFKYTADKEYHLFLYRAHAPVDISQLICESTFETRDGTQLIEVDKYQVASLDYALKLLNPRQAKIIALVLDKIT